MSKDEKPSRYIPYDDVAPQPYPPRLGLQQRLTKHSASFIPQALDQMFKAMAAEAEAQSMNMDWYTMRIEVGVDRSTSLPPDMRFLLLSMNVDLVPK